jgi:hypothetical protein
MVVSVEIAQAVCMGVPSGARDGKVGGSHIKPPARLCVSFLYGFT